MSSRILRRSISRGSHSGMGTRLLGKRLTPPSARISTTARGKRKMHARKVPDPSQAELHVLTNPRTKKHQEAWELVERKMNRQGKNVPSRQWVLDINRIQRKYPFLNHPYLRKSWGVIAHEMETKPELMKQFERFMEGANEIKLIMSKRPTPKLVAFANFFSSPAFPGHSTHHFTGMLEHAGPIGAREIGKAFAERSHELTAVYSYCSGLKIAELFHAAGKGAGAKFIALSRINPHFIIEVLHTSYDGKLLGEILAKDDRNATLTTRILTGGSYDEGYHRNLGVYLRKNGADALISEFRSDPEGTSARIIKAY